MRRIWACLSQVSQPSEEKLFREQVTAMEWSIRANNPPSILDFSYRDLNDEQIRDICRLLRQGRAHFTQINLEKCGLTDERIVPIMDQVYGMSNLRCFYLAFNKLGNNWLQSLVTHLGVEGRLGHLSHVDLRGQDGGDMDLAQLHRLLRQRIPKKSGARVNDMFKFAEARRQEAAKLSLPTGPKEYVFKYIKPGSEQTMQARTNGWRVLCIDGGGTRGIVPLTVLQSLKARTGKEPWQIFDVMVGTSTGGILAVLLGLLKIPVDVCIGLYEKLGKDVFEPRIFDSYQSHPVRVLERVIKEILEEHCNGKADIRLDELGQEDGRRPYVVLVANKEGFDVPYRFANFRSDNDCINSTSRVSVWAAIRATLAAPTYFDPIKIDVPGVGGHGVWFYDGGSKYNNPIEVARTLMKLHPFKGIDPSAFVSLGAGMNNCKLGEVASPTGPLKTMVEDATKSEHVHRTANEQLQGHARYFRFNPSHGVGGDLPMDSMAYVKQMRNATEEYLTIQETTTEMNCACQALAG